MQEKAGQIINACAVLHNMCIRANIPLPPDTVFGWIFLFTSRIVMSRNFSHPITELSNENMK